MFPGTFDEVVRAVEKWIPKKDYRKERGFQEDLRDFLREELNRPMGLFGDFTGSREHLVKLEGGRAKARVDITVDWYIGIELKRHLDNKHLKDLRGELGYFKEGGYTGIIIVACGVANPEAWDEVKRFAKGNVDILGRGTRVIAIKKDRKEFGKGTIRKREERAQPKGFY